jgi:hypothetical protein
MLRIGRQKLYAAHGGAGSVLLQLQKVIRLILLIALSVGGGVATALSYAASVDPNVGFRSLTLPAVAEIACLFGSLGGLLISPLMVWAFYDKNLWIAVPGIYGLACVGVVALNVLSMSSPIMIISGVTVAALVLYGLFGKRRPTSQFSDEWN